MGCYIGTANQSGNEGLPVTVITANENVPDTDLPYVTQITPGYVFLTFPNTFPGDNPGQLYGNAGGTYNYTCTIGGSPVSVVIPPNTYQVMGSQAYAEYLAEQAAQQAATLACEEGGGGVSNPAVGNYGNIEVTATVTCP